MGICDTPTFFTCRSELCLTSNSIVVPLWQAVPC